MLRRSGALLGRSLSRVLWRQRSSLLLHPNPYGAAVAATATSIRSTHQWHIQKPARGRGFDNFLPDDDDDDDGAEPSSSDQKTKKKSDQKTKKSDDRTQHKQQRGGGSSNNNTTGLLLLLAALGFVIYKLNNEEEGDESSRDHQQQQQQSSNLALREIAWHDFLSLLKQGRVEKIMIGGGGGGGESSSVARVYLRPESGSRLMMTTTGDGVTFTDRFDTSPTATTGSTTLIPPPMMMDHQHHGYYKLHIGSADSFERKLEDAQSKLGFDIGREVPVQYATDRTLTREVLGIAPGVILAALLYLYMSRFGSSMTGGGSGGGRGGMGGIFQFGKSNARKIKKEDIHITFKDVAGCDEAKLEVMEFVDFLKDSDRFTKLGAKIPKGALLCGPPGTGKTMLAKAVAGEAGVPFFSISGSDFVEMFVGVGPSRVRDLFKEARSHAPCIVFIDEIDAVGRKRGRRMGGNDEQENTLNQLLVEMDGFTPTTGVVVLAGTNRVDILDPALTRPGRFDRQITVDKPDLKGRKQVFQVHLKGITLEDSVDDIAGRLAGLTPGFSGADIANLCNEAAIVAARRKGEMVTLEDFEKATDRIIGGLESNKIMSKSERSIVAHHEAGHAVAGWFLEHADPLLKVTIIPRSSGALGFAQYLPKEVYLRTLDQINDIVCMALAGRASEEIFFGRVTTGASDDLKRVTELVYSTIQLYGMNERLGQLVFPKDPNAMFEDRPYSEKTAKAMDEEAKRFVDAAYRRTLDLLTSKKDQVQKIAQLLLDKETITHDDMIEVIGSRPFKGDPQYEEFIRRRKKVKTTDQDVEEPPVDLNPGLL